VIDLVYFSADTMPGASIIVNSGEIKYFNTFRFKLMAGVLFINLFIVTLTVIFLYQSKIQFEKRAAQTAQNLSRISADYIDSVIDKIDLALVMAADELGRHKPGKTFTPGNLNIVTGNGIIDPLDIDSIHVTDSHGTILFSAGVSSEKPVNISDDDFFKNLLNSTKSELVISEPELEKLSKSWHLKLARRINRPDGSFAGVIYAVTGIEHFQKAFAAIDLGKYGSLTLRNKNLAIIAQNGKFEESDSSTIGQKTDSSKLKELINAGQVKGTYQAKYPEEGVTRIFSFTKVIDHPFFVTVGISTSSYLVEWRREVVEASIALLFFILITILVSCYFLTNWQQQQGIIAAYRDSEECFRAIFENALVGSLLATPDGKITKVNLMFENLLGYSAEDLNSLNIKDIIFPDDFENDRDMFQSMLEGMRNFYQIEKRLVTNYYTVIWGMLSVSVVRDQLGEPRFIVYMRFLQNVLPSCLNRLC